MESVPVAIALGSNMGDREQYLHDGCQALTRIVDRITISRFHDTAPVGNLAQPRFLNAAVVGDTSLSARDVLEALLGIEMRFGRVRPYPGSPRTLDLDLILYGDRILEEPGLSVPHPRFRDRAFVLEPLAEVAPEWRDPVTGSTIAMLRDSLERLTGHR